LPYHLIAGVVPCRGGWLVAGGKLVGTGLFPEAAVVERRLSDITEAIPSFSVITLSSPIGLPDKPSRRGRQCDREARRLLGWPRLGAILSPPSLSVAQRAKSYEHAIDLNGGSLTRTAWAQIRHIREVRETIQSHSQRRVYEVHPELSFHQLNGDRPLRHGKRTQEGQEERWSLLVARLQNLESRLEAGPPKSATLANLLDAYAALSTARRISARAISRLPEEPEWNSEGMRMEIVR
jgi:predicted RNase H-like nuclease